MLWTTRHWIVSTVVAAFVGMASAIGGCARAERNETEVVARPTRSAEVASQDYAIEGMTCEGCVQSVTAAIEKVPGVQSVKVSLKDKKATVVGDLSQATPEKIEAAVAAAGYKAKRSQ
jgi:copper chaperone CopZ